MRLIPAVLALALLLAPATAEAAAKRKRTTSQGLLGSKRPERPRR